MERVKRSQNILFLLLAQKSLCPLSSVILLTFSDGKHQSRYGSLQDRFTLRIFSQLKVNVAETVSPPCYHLHAKKLGTVLSHLNSLLIKYSSSPKF